METLSITLIKAVAIGLVHATSIGCAQGKSIASYKCYLVSTHITRDIAEAITPSGAPYIS